MCEKKQRDIVQLTKGMMSFIEDILNPFKVNNIKSQIRTYSNDYVTVEDDSDFKIDESDTKQICVEVVLSKDSTEEELREASLRMSKFKKIVPLHEWSKFKKINDNVIICSFFNPNKK